MKLFLNHTFSQLWADKDPFVEVLQLNGKEYRNKEGRRTLQLTLGGHSYFLKVHQGIGWKEIIKNLLQFRLPVIGASNEYLAAKKLAELGVDTLTPVAYGKRGSNPARQLSFILTEDLSNTTSLEDYCADWKQSPPPFVQKRALIDLLANVSRTMHGAGINHRDYYLCHFLLANDTIDQLAHPKCFLIDLHRAQLRASTPYRWAVKDIAGLYFSAMDAGLKKRDLFRFIRIYGGGNLREEFLRNGDFWREVQSKATKLYIKDHGKAPEVVFSGE